VGMSFAIELEQEADGRWIAEVPDLPGVLAYGATERAAIAAVEALALRVLADRVELGEAEAPLSISFVPAAA
jgi:predicted RNase H-like HicB family nuclease